MSCTVQFEPSGRAIEIEPGCTLLSAARAAEIPLHAACAGRGSCGTCRVRILSGPLPPATAQEAERIPEGDRAQGWRLACQYTVTAPVAAETLRIQGHAKGEALLKEEACALAPSVRRWAVQVSAPTLDRPVDDAGNLCAALAQAGSAAVNSFDVLVARQIPEVLRASAWSVLATVRSGELVGLRPRSGARAPLGLAVDMGTTNLAAYLFRLDTGALRGVFAAPNPLSTYGADIISRLTYGEGSAEHRNQLQRLLARAVNLLAAHAARGQECTVEDIEEMVVVGNTGMHHLFLGLPGRQLTRAPFVPAFRAAQSIKARDLGITIAPGGYVYMPPLVGGFVGSDLLAVALSTRIDSMPGTRLAVDIGTNTELLLSVDGALHCCSTASGPALEGGALKFGTLAEPGAIDRMWIAEPAHAPEYHTIENQPVTGICGSGIIDALNCLRQLGDVSRAGRLRTGSTRVIPETGGDHRCVLARAESTALGADLTISQMEIRAVLLAKGAISAGIETLLALQGLDANRVDELMIAGTFGNHLSIESAAAIGLFAGISPDRIRQIGNAAGVGAGMMLLSEDQRRTADELSRAITHVELALQGGFRQRFARAQWFPEESA